MLWKRTGNGRMDQIMYDDFSLQYYTVTIIARKSVYDFQIEQTITG